MYQVTEAAQDYLNYTKVRISQQSCACDHIARVTNHNVTSHSVTSHNVSSRLKPEKSVSNIEQQSRAPLSFKPELTLGLPRLVQPAG